MKKSSCETFWVRNAQSKHSKKERKKERAPSVDKEKSGINKIWLEIKSRKLFKMTWFGGKNLWSWTNNDQWPSVAFIYLLVSEREWLLSFSNVFIRWTKTNDHFATITMLLRSIYIVDTFALFIFGGKCRFSKWINCAYD